jgi:hypothetical protein
MTKWQQEKDALLDKVHAENLKRCQEMRVPPQPVRDDRKDQGPWRPKK